VAKWVIFEHTSGGHIQATSASSYAAARLGDTKSVNTGDYAAHFGHRYDGSWHFWEAFVRFVTTAVTDKVIAAYLDMMIDLPYGVQWDKVGGVHVYRRDWGTGLTTGDFVSGEFIQNSMTPVCVAKADKTGATLLELELWNVNIMHFLIVTERQVAGVGPGSSGTQSGVLRYYTAEALNNTTELILYTMPSNVHTFCGDNLIELSDGTWVAERFQTSTGDVTQLWHSADGITWTAIGSTQDAAEGIHARGRQSRSLTRDSDDNLYLVSFGSGGANTMRALMFAKGLGYTWTEQTPRYTGDTSALAISRPGTSISAQWVDTGGGVGGKGHIYVSMTQPNVPTSGNGTVNDIGRSAISSPPAIVATKPLVFEAGALRDADWPGTLGPNSTYGGTLGVATDHVPDGSNLATLVDNGYVLSMIHGGNELVRTTTTSSGGRSTSLFDAGATALLETGATKIRTVKAGSIYFTLAGTLETAKNYTSWENSVSTLAKSRHFIHSGAPERGGSALWDMVYDPIKNRVWVYYVPVGTTHVARWYYSITSGGINFTPVTVSTTAIPAGASPYSLRAVSTPTRLGKVPIEVAYTASDGTTKSFAFLFDNLSTPPQAPTLDPFEDYDATAAATLRWTFNDEDPDDSQSAYEVEIINASGGATAIDTGKLVGSTSSYTIPAAALANGNTYQVRVRVWDSHDAVGAWSNWMQFTATTTPTVTITSAYDLATGEDTYIVGWSYTQPEGAGQAYYRVANTVGGTPFYDTGWVAGAATVYEVPLSSDVPNTISVEVESTLGLRSVADTEVFTPAFLYPMTPTVVATTLPHGVRLDITNPAPTAGFVEASHNEVWRSQPGDPSETQAAAAILGERTSNGLYTTGGYTYLKIADVVPASEQVPVVLNANPGFESDTDGWVATGGALSRSEINVRSGTAAALLIPDGVSATAQIEATAAAGVAVTAGTGYALTAYLYITAGHPTANLALVWLDSANAVLDTTESTPTPVDAASWTEFVLSGEAPAGAVKVLARVALTGTPSSAVETWIDDVEITGPDVTLIPTTVTDLDLYSGAETRYIVKAVG